MILVLSCGYVVAAGSSNVVNGTMFGKWGGTCDSLILNTVVRSNECGPWHDQEYRGRLPR